MNNLHRLGRSSARHPWRVISIWFLVAALVGVLAATSGRELEDAFEAPGLDSSAALELLTRAESAAAGPTAQVVVTPRNGGSFFESSDAVGALADAQRQVAALPNVLGTSDPAGALALGRSAAVESGTVSASGEVAIIRVQYDLIDNLDPVDLDRLKELASTVNGDNAVAVELSGDLLFAFEQPETNVGELVGLAVAVVILLFAFGSLIAMGLPIGLALFGLALGIASMSLITYLVEIPSWAPDMASMIGLGVGIDYALLLVTRYREYLADGLSVPDAAGSAVATAGQSVIFAGGTVVVAILGLAVAGVPFMTAAGIAISVIVLLMVIASITLLPAFLGLAGERINGLRAKTRARYVAARQRGTAVSARWERWGEHVARNAWRYTVGVTAGLLALAAPVLALRVGFPDEGTLPTSRTERRAYDLVAEGFGAGTNGPLVIAIDIARDSTVVEPLRDAVAADIGIASVSPAQVDSDAGIATFVAIASTSPQDAATLSTIDRLRDDVFPAVLAGRDAAAHVGGQTASFSDIGGRVSSRMPIFISAVVIVSVLLLTVVFRSIVVAIKAAVMNMLSIGAAYGVLVMVFQWGWGADLIGLESTVPIVAFLPMFMFAILFGLSMDYEVFLLSRVREEYLRTGDNDSAVLHGIASTARVITSAALIMIAVFLGFVVSDDPALKMVGLGLATAIFIDATVVRMVLVPALMRLMGDANWWLPRWLDRALPEIHLDGAPASHSPSVVG
jgi:putative drug exporter of the RND superfamily